MIGMNTIQIYLLPSLNFLLIKKNKTSYIYIYSKNWFMHIDITSYKITFKKSLNIIELVMSQPINNLEIKKINNAINNFLFSWELLFFKKLTFSGKGFKLKKKQKIIFFFFNKSHISLLICNTAIIKKLNKNKILFFFKNQNFYNAILNKIIKIRYANIYTKRGLRFSRQLILKRKGKGGVQPQ